MNIEFYIPSTEKIPTRLMLKAGDVQINYRRANEGFAYIFEAYGIKSADEGLEIVKEISRVMQSQSYDHGAEWRETGIEQIEEFQYNSAKWKVSFRIKDSY